MQVRVQLTEGVKQGSVRGSWGVVRATSKPFFNPFSACKENCIELAFAATEGGIEG